MDISFTNVLEGARQYFQGVPASNASNPASDLDRLKASKQQQPQQQQQNDGSVRSEQHTAVPVYWDQQNEGQAAAMSTAQQRLPPPPPMAMHSSNQPLPQPIHPHVATYQPHIATVQPVGGGSVKTYHELQTNRSNATSFNYPAAVASHYSYGGAASSSQTTDYTGYKMTPRGAPQHQQQQYLYPRPTPPPPPPPARHLPVQPSNMYHHSSRNVVAMNSKATPASFSTSNAFFYGSTPLRPSFPKTKRESPLDLSVKTVRTTADSTLGSETEERRKTFEHYSARAPKVDFLPNFAMQHEQIPRNNYCNYGKATSALPKVDMDFQQRKRTLEYASGSSFAPEKMPKIDMWRANIDKQIDERFSSYQAARNEAANQKVVTATVATPPMLHNGASSRSQQYPQSPFAYYNSIGTVPIKSSAKLEASSKPQANKKVLNLLRTSLQNKTVRQPSTDVMAPLQPKPGIVGRRNVSPFTAASLERNSNTPPTYKFHIPKAIDSVIISDDGTAAKEQQEAVICTPSTDLDGLAAFLAARIRTKGERKQVMSDATPPMKMKQETGTATLVAAFMPKKLFARNEMKRAEVRSSSETSVFDFPDSDNETEMPLMERQSLVEMRKDRRAVPVKCLSERVASPFSLLFQQTCDSFVEQLQRGNGKKRGRRKKDLETVVKLETSSVHPSDSDSDTPLVHLASKQLKMMKKKKKALKEHMSSEDSEVETFSRNAKADFYERMKSPIAICKPGKKPAFGDGSDFRPGWEEALYKYKKAIRIPVQLIQVTRPPSSQRLSTSLPDLDPCHMSPAPKMIDCLDSDLDSSNCSFNFAKLTNYDSDQGSMKSYSSKSSILDKLLERIGPMRRRRLQPKVIPKSDNVEAVKSKSPLEAVGNCFTSRVVGVSEFTAVVMKSRTRTETRVLKEKATIREVFGEDRPASAPPVTCVDELKTDEAPASVKGGKENFHQQQQQLQQQLIKVIESKKLAVATATKKRIDDAVTTTGKRRNKLRRKFSSGFDYIRKKKKHSKKEEADEADAGMRAKRRGALTKATPGSIDDIQREIKQWVLNKGVGETHLHRASRCGYTDITAYCLEKMSSHPSPKDNAGYTPLHEACAKGHLDIARLLLQYGAQVSESAQGGIRPLHEAAENGYIEIVRLLLSYGADPTLATYAGQTPLQLASDDATITLLQQHLDEVQGKPNIAPWHFNGPSRTFDGIDEGYNPLNEVPDADIVAEEEDIVFEASEYLLPNLYALPEGDAGDRWMLLQDLANVLRIKSKETLLRQLNLVAASSAKREHLREMKMSEFLETARCCQFMNANEKLNARASKICLVKYTEKVQQLLNVEHISIPNAR